MADPSATVVSERVKGYVSQKLLPTLADGIFSGNVLMFRILNNTSAWTGGIQMVRSMVWKVSTLGSSFALAETFSTTAEDTTIRLAFDKKNYAQPVTVFGAEVAHVNSDRDSIQLVTNKLQEAKMNMAQNVGNMFYGDGTGNSSKDFNGTANIVDDGTNSPTYGGQTRATYGDALDAQLATAVGTLDLDHIASQYDAASGTGAGMTMPTIMVTTKSIYSGIESLLTPTLSHSYVPMMAIPASRVYSKGPARNMTDKEAMHGNFGFPSMAFRGVPIVADDLCPSGELIGLNENELTFYVVRDKNLKSIPTGMNTFEGSTYNETPEMSPVQFRGWMPLTAQYGETCQLILQGQLISWNPRRHFRSTGITGV